MSTTKAQLGVDELLVHTYDYSINVLSKLEMICTSTRGIAADTFLDKAGVSQGH